MLVKKRLAKGGKMETSTIVSTIKNKESHRSGGQSDFVLPLVELVLANLSNLTISLFLFPLFALSPSFPSIFPPIHCIFPRICLTFLCWWAVEGKESSWPCTVLFGLVYAPHRSHESTYVCLNPPVKPGRGGHSHTTLFSLNWELVCWKETLRFS